MTTKVYIRNDGHEHTIAVHTVKVQKLAGRRELVDSNLSLMLAPGSDGVLYVHECQEIRVTELRKL